MLYIPEDTNVALFSNIDKCVVFNTKDLVTKTSRSTQGVQVMTMRRKSLLSKMALPEAVIYSGKKKSKKLANKGMRVAGTRTAWTPENIGQEIGSVVETENTFKVQEISFNVMSNGIKGLKLSINIYALNEEKMQYCNVMHTPISIDVPPCTDKKE